ncbi:MAG TPA: hypothetical protein VK486_10990 [Thermoleophilaceae bacterium]|nr:hypothetical protein [Thermoleophilaceae bacterium]
MSYGIPTATALLLSLGGWAMERTVGPFSSAEVQGLLGVVSLMLVGWLASSHVDWYYIRSRVDGVVTKPPCRTSRDTMWKGVTRKWYIHRGVASLLTMFTIVAVALIVTVMLDREWPGALGAIGGFAAIAGVGLWLMRDEIRNAAPAVSSARSPRYWVGDDLKYDTDVWRRRGYVLHVAIPVTKLIPLHRYSGARMPDADFVEEPATELHRAHCKPTAFTRCLAAVDDCGRMNTECLWGLPREQVGERRFLVY